MAMTHPVGNKPLRTGLRDEQNIFRARFGRGQQAAPLADRNQNSRLDTALGHDLWPFLEASLERALNRAFASCTGQVCGIHAFHSAHSI